MFETLSATGDGGGQGTSEHIAGHTEHCFDYLKQAIICHGDTTLEKAHLHNETKYGSIKLGWGDVHQCRNHETIINFAAQNSINKWFPKYTEGLVEID
jgi:hypothetical protein